MEEVSWIGDNSASGQTGGKMKDVVIVCETDGCENKGQIINEVELLDCDLDSFMKSFGVSGYESADCCDKCGKHGILLKEAFSKAMDRPDFEKKVSQAIWKSLGISRCGQILGTPNAKENGSD